MKNPKTRKIIIILFTIVLFSIGYGLNILQSDLGFPLVFFFGHRGYYQSPHPSFSAYELDKYIISRHLVYLKNKSSNNKTVIDVPVNGTGCNQPLQIKPGTSRNIAVWSGNLWRIYRLYLPKNYTNNTPRALILNFHGYTSNGLIQESLSRFNPLANKEGFMVVYPEGSFSKDRVQGWNTGLHKTITANDVLFVSDILNSIQNNFCVNPRKIYATGFSNGGGLVSKLMCAMSDRIAAFSPVSASYVTSPKQCKNPKPVSIIDFHGTADRIVPYNGNPGKKEMAAFFWIKDWAKHDKCLTVPVVIYKSPRITGYSFPSCKNKASVIHYKIIGGQHTWPRVRFKQEINNNTTHYVDVSKIIWDFFQNHPLVINNKPKI